MVEIINDTFAGKVKQGDTLEDFKMIAERNGITVCAPGTCTSKIWCYNNYYFYLFIFLFIFYLPHKQKIILLCTAQFLICIHVNYAVF